MEAQRGLSAPQTRDSVSPSVLPLQEENKKGKYSPTEDKWSFVQKLSSGDGKGK